MKKHLYTLLKILCLAYLVCIFSACDSAKTNLQTLDEASVRALLDMETNEGRFYQMQGSIGDEDISAYVWITDAIDGRFPNGTMHLIIEARGHYNDDFKKNERLYLPLSKIKLGLESSALAPLVIEGVWDVENNQGFEDSIFANKPFSFKQNRDSSISEVATFTLEYSKRANNGNYVSSMQSTFITPQNTLDSAIIEKLNHSISAHSTKAALIESMHKNLEDYYKDVLDANNGDFGGANIEHLVFENVIYVDNHILILKHIDYTYTGGAHGMSEINIKAFDVAKGEAISPYSEDLISNDKTSAFLDMLTQRILKNRGEDVFAESMPLSALPERFFVSDRGFVFVFAPYVIAPYAMGHIEIEIDFEAMKDFISPNSPYAYLVQ